jgi:hypothetical protein
MHPLIYYLSTHATRQVREVLTCHVVHEVPLPPPLDDKYVEDVADFTSKMWGQW